MSLRMLDSGPLALLQDAGRLGYGHLGVPRSGAFDRRAMHLANRLVGNPERAVVVEFLLGGARLRAETSVTVAITGAIGDPEVAGRPVGTHAPVRISAGAELHLPPARLGLRYYLAVRGGFRVPEVLGSASTDRLSGLGPAALSAGTMLRIGPTPTGQPNVDQAPARPLAQTLMVVRGHDADDATFRRFLAVEWHLDPRSDRIGVRLTGDPIESTPTASGRSRPMVAGAVQLPPNGLPIILGPDHPTTGGYPIIATLTRDSLDDVAQWRGGARRFRATT